MALAVWQRTIVNELGNIQAGATITVRSETSGAPLAVLKSDRDGLVALANPFNADAEGFAQFFVAGGAYRIDAVLGSFSRTWRYVAVGTMAETDAGAVPIPSPTLWTFDAATADADPGDGEFRLNNADPSLATLAYIDNANFGGVDSSTWLDTLDNFGTAANRGVLAIFDAANPSALFRLYTVSGSVVDGGGYRKVTIAHIIGGGSFVAGDEYTFTFYGTGLAGSVTGPGAVVNEHGVRWDGTSGNLIESLGQYNLFSQTVQVNNSATLLADQGGSLIIASNNPTIVTLPAASGGALRFGFFNAVSVGNKTLTVTRAGADSFLMPDGSSVTSFDLVGLGSSAIIVSDGGATWAVFSSHARPIGINQGRQTISIPAGAMYTPSTAGAAAATTELVASAPINALRTLAFDQNNEEVAFFMIPLPKSWDGLTPSAEFLWTATAGAGDVLWSIALRVFSEGDALEQAFGTQVDVLDTLTTAGDLHVSGETSGGIPLAGTPADDSVLFGRITREAADASDTLTADALLLGIRLFIGINAPTDA